jgi:DNA-binding protein YbaB
MDPQDRSGPRDRRAQLEARNAAMRRQVGSLLDGPGRRAGALRTAQAQVAGVTGRAGSPDGLVTATVDAAGVVTDVRLAPSAFTRSTPDQLARSVVAATRQAAADARRQVETALAPVRAGLPDLPEVFPGAPSLKDLLSPPPARRPPTRHGAHHDYDDEDFSTNSVLRGGRG